jgi:hypothetical protein
LLSIDLEPEPNHEQAVELEYAHVDLGTEDHFANVCDSCEGSAEFDVVKVDVNYKFGSRHGDALK